jgi:hypothetical protein
MEVFYAYNRPLSNIVKLTPKGVTLMGRVVGIIEK